MGLEPTRGAGIDRRGTRWSAQRFCRRRRLGGGTDAHRSRAVQGRMGEGWPKTGAPACSGLLHGRVLRMFSPNLLGKSGATYTHASHIELGGIPRGPGEAEDGVVGGPSYPPLRASTTRAGMLDWHWCLPACLPACACPLAVFCSGQVGRGQSQAQPNWRLFVAILARKVGLACLVSLRF